MAAPDYFDALKNDLDITYDDPETDAKLLGQCRRAEAYLRTASGHGWLTFSVNMADQELLQLLFDCVRYIRSNALNRFAENYGDDLFRLRSMSHIWEQEREEEFGNEAE
jgi:hypothetical protein